MTKDPALAIQLLSFIQQLLSSDDASLRSLLSLFSNALVMPSGATIENPLQFGSLPLTDLRLSVRAFNCITKQLGISTAGELCERTDKELLALRSFGKTCLRETQEALASYGLRLRPSRPVCLPGF